MISELEKICKIETDVDLTMFNTYRLHSYAYAVIYPKSIEELKYVLFIIKKYNSKYFVIGNGSNIILPDYYDGVIIKLDGFNKCIIASNQVYVESSYMLNRLALELSNKGYTGLEWATGIPGTIGGSIYNNAGSYNSSMSDILVSVIVFDGNNIKEYLCEELNFGYRTSLFKEETDKIILSCNIKINKGIKENIKELIESRTKKRIETQDLIHPSCGSVFRNPVNNYAGKLIEDASLKGYHINDAYVSNKHANFIINMGNATSKDIIKLIKYIKKEVKSKYNVDLILEQEIIK